MNNEVSLPYTPPPPQGDQKQEAVHINKSLTQLGLCINSLANKKDHIPFRNSQLTTLLQVWPR